MTVAFSLSMGAGGTPIDSRKLNLSIDTLKGIRLLALLAEPPWDSFCVVDSVILLATYALLSISMGLLFYSWNLFLSGRLWLSSVN